MRWASCSSTAAKTTCCGAPIPSGTARRRTRSSRSARFRSRRSSASASAIRRSRPALRAKVFGLNAAQVYGISAAELKKFVARDTVRGKARLCREPEPHFLTYGPKTRREFLACRSLRRPAVPGHDEAAIDRPRHPEDRPPREQSRDRMERAAEADERRNRDADDEAHPASSPAAGTYSMVVTMVAITETRGDRRAGLR